MKRFRHEETRRIAEGLLPLFVEEAGRRSVIELRDAVKVRGCILRRAAEELSALELRGLVAASEAWEAATLCQLELERICRGASVVEAEDVPESLRR